MAYIYNAPYGYTLVTDDHGRVVGVLTPDGGDYLKPYVAVRGSITEVKDCIGKYTPEQFRKKLYNKSVYLD